MGNKYRSAKCPYYREDQGFRLVCESAMEGGRTTIQIFHNRKALLTHRGRFCVRSCDNCPHKQAVDRKYRESEERAGSELPGRRGGNA